MPSKEIIAGISISRDLASLAVLEHRADEIELLFLDEQKQVNESQFWYLNPLEKFLENRRTKVNQVAVALDPAKLLLLSCPLDTSLSQSERNEHIHWELSHYIKNYQPKEYINDVHILETRAQEQVQHVLAVAVQRDVIFGLQQALSQQGLTLGIVDVNHFATETSLLRSHPEIGKTICACIGVNQSRIDVSILRNGYMINYRYSVSLAAEANRSLFGEILDQRPLAGVYLYGTHLSKDQERLIKSFTKSTTVVLNPFRKILISHDFPGFTRYINQTHRFAAAVGIALRKA